MAITAGAVLPTPSFSFTPPLRCVAGVRPFRTSGFRLDVERPASSGGKIIVHNYGHGGAGISLSWGCASKVRDLVRANLSPSGRNAVAVLGSGVMGLTAATLLRRMALPVTIYTEAPWTCTTSAVAGGQWAPSIVNYADRRQLKEVLEISHAMFKASIGNGFGVFERPNYTTTQAEALELVRQVSPGLITRREHSRLPFEHHAVRGFEYQTLLVEPPIFLKRLSDDLVTNNVPVIIRSFARLTDVLQLQENIIVNCTGMGAKDIFNDRDMQGRKGQLALLPAQPRLQYLYSKNGYMFPRTDAVVIGGSDEKVFTSPDPNPIFCQKLVDHMKGVLGGGPPVPLPRGHIHHPDNLRDLAPGEVLTS
jgi:D-amino-acid oxidase